jgi:hypothetical protein
MTNNIMVNRKRSKGQTMIYNILHRKLKNNTNPTKTGGELRCSGRVGSPCSFNDNATNISNANTSGSGKNKTNKKLHRSISTSNHEILFQI